MRNLIYIIIVRYLIIISKEFLSLKDSKHEKYNFILYNLITVYNNLF